MGQAITYYIVNEKKLSFSDFEKLNPKPNILQLNNFGTLKNFVEQNTKEDCESEIIIDTDNNRIIINL